MNMQLLDRRTKVSMRGLLVAALIAGLLAMDRAPASAQLSMQLDPPAPEYTLGRFRYVPPRFDGWRQIADSTQSLSLVYAEQIDQERIETRFGVAIEVHDIPPEAEVADAAFLAEISRRQMGELRMADLVATSPIAAVPSTTNLYTYRFLVKAPEGLDYDDSYEVYYVAMAPDKSQYVVMQCITKTQDYENHEYFQQFYASLTNLRYVGEGSSPAAQPDASTTTTDSPAAGQADKSGEGAGAPTPVAPASEAEGASAETGKEPAASPTEPDAATPAAGD